MDFISIENFSNSTKIIFIVLFPIILILIIFSNIVDKILSGDLCPPIVYIKLYLC